MQIPPSLPEEKIVKTLAYLLGHSNAGDVMHQVLVYSAGPDAIGPLGTVDPDKVRSAGYMIAPVNIDAEQYVADQLQRIRIETLGRRERVLFAAMSQETWQVSPMDDLGRRLLAKGRLFEHPDVVEVSLVYGVAADGRRWTGRRWLTGPKAGQSEDVELLVGTPDKREAWGLPAAPYLRRLAGMDQ